MKPFVKWAGGKTQNINFILENMPKTYNRYFEPFIGGGAVLFSIAPSLAYINDINEQLINIYKQIKNNSNKIIKGLNELDNKSCDKELYYLYRKKFNEKIINNQFDIECAILMIWINKHCFNGL